jgi:hypothetical protein
MKDNGIHMLKETVLWQATISTYSKLGTHRTNEEVIYIVAPRETRTEIIQQAARNYCYKNDLTVSSDIKLIAQCEQPTFEIIEADRSEIERKQPLVVTVPA